MKEEKPSCFFHCLPERVKLRKLRLKLGELTQRDIKTFNPIDILGVLC